MVWVLLILRYRAAGFIGCMLSCVFIWLLLVFYTCSTYALSEAAIVAIVLNIGLAADAHIIAFERAREDLLSDSEDAFFLRGRRAPREKKEGRGRRRQRRKERATHAAADPRRESRED